MNALENHLDKLDKNLYLKFIETKKEVTLLLNAYAYNFPTYTDHSINHTLDVFEITSDLLTPKEISQLNADEAYILSMACILHDVGMCIPEEKIHTISGSESFVSYKQSYPNLSTEEYIRDIHHTLSNKFIQEEWESLKIPSKKYAKAIALVAEGHRKVDLGNFDIYEPRFFPKSGKEFSCLPYLACILRIADELDVTNSRTPKLLTKYYMPNNDKSVLEWSKHIATSQRNYLDNKVIFEVDCSDQNIYAALQDQFDKIQKVINYCQKIIRSIPSYDGVTHSLNLGSVDVRYNFMGFDPKGIKFSFDVQKVVTAFIGEDLYNEKLTALREAIQNSIDSCRYKKAVLNNNYAPEIKVLMNSEFIEIVDNGAGMDEFIIENFFSKLGSSFYEQDKVKTQFEAIGQFGVGVFSYFLLSEYVDIETKTYSGRPLKFRFDNDPKGYFNFYTDTTRTVPGTTIRLYLKPHLKGSINSTEVKNYLQQLFRHIEFEIELNLLGISSKIKPQGFEIDFPKQLKTLIKHQHKNLINEFDKIHVHINNDEVEGVCYLICKKEYFRSSDKLSRYCDSREASSNIFVSQKGVFIATLDSPLLSYVFGEINIKKKIKINIDRNHFSNEEEIESILYRFEKKILEKLFDLFTQLANDNNSKLYLSNLFLGTYISFNSGSSHPENISNLIKQNMFVTIYNNGKRSVSSISNFIKTCDQAVFVPNNDKAKEVSTQLNSPVVSIHNEHAYNYTYTRVFLRLFKFQQYVQPLKTEAHFGYQFNHIDHDYRIKLQKLDDFSEESDIIKANGSKLKYSIWEDDPLNNNTYADIINYNHDLIQFIIRNINIIENDFKFIKILNSLFDYLSEIDDVDNDFLKKINALIDSLNEIGYLKKLTIEDF